MLNKRAFLALVVLLGLTMFASAQTRISSATHINEPCTAVQLMASTEPGSAPQPAEWEIRSGYQVLFSTSDLSNPAFPAGTVVDTETIGHPIFGCTENGLLRLQVLSQGNAGQVATIMRRSPVGQWSVDFGSTIGHNSAFPNPGAVGFPSGTTFVRATALLTQGNRTVMLGEFGGLQKFWRAYDITGQHVAMYDFGSLRTDAISQACVTNSNLWFVVQVGTFTQLFSVDGTGKLSLTADYLIPAVSNGSVTLSCTASAINIEIASKNGVRANYMLPDEAAAR